MSDKKKIYKPNPISGFPEWTPDVRMIEQQWLDHIRSVFESYGFCNIETPSVEELDVIAAKGDDVDKEIYVIERLHKDEDDTKEARLALHFDQTVPLARYVAQHFNDLIFPFKRYQMQRVWRGERPQAGRFREFYQCDIDVINVDNLPLHFDAEMPAIIWEILSSLPGMENEKIKLQISNRKIFVGLLEALVIEQITDVMSIIDKLEKLGKENTENLLHEQTSMDKNHSSKLLSLAQFKTNDPAELREYAESMEVDNETFHEGIEELAFVLEHLQHLPKESVYADLSIVRGLDYYTGTVYETRFADDPTYGSICSGGRYDDLADSYINKHLPGVGISIGFSRLFDRIRQKQQLPIQKHSPADILVVMPNEDQRGVAIETANTLRGRGFNVEMAHGGKLKKQLAYAEKKAIPYVWFPPFEDGAEHEVKDMSSGEQTNAKPDDWSFDDVA